MSDQQQDDEPQHGEYWCEICSCDCQSNQSFQQHIQGLKHRKLAHRAGLGPCPTNNNLKILADEEEFFDNLANGHYKNIVILTGAGVSTAAGIPDYRSSGGFFERFQQQYKGRFPGVEATPESLFSRAFVRKYPEVWENELLPSKQAMFQGLEPTLTHKFCAYLSQQGWLKRIYTQNIDGLHSHPILGMILLDPEKVVECHGSIRRGDLVLYGDPLPSYFQETVQRDFDPTDMEARVDLILVMGTSLQVAPFCALPNMAPKGSTRVLVNRNLSDCIRNPYGAQSWIESGYYHSKIKATAGFGKYHKEVPLEALWMKRDKLKRKKWQQLLIEDDSDAFVRRYMEKTNSKLEFGTGHIGSIPSELWTVTTLQTLGLNGNFLTGTIPSGISAMTNLVNLYGGYNDLTGSLPDDLDGMTQLTYINLNENFLTGTIPPLPSSITSCTFALEAGNGVHFTARKTEGNCFADTTNAVSCTLSANCP